MPSKFRRTITPLCLSLAVLFWASFVMAQGIVTGSISGTVEDPQGAVVSGAKVTAKHLATNRDYITASTSGGVVSLRTLPPGTYDVRVEAPSFRTFESKGLVVAVGSDTALGAVRLEVGASTETVTVEAVAAPLIEGTTDQISETFTTQKTAGLPIGNSFDSLALFIPGVATAGDVSFSNNNGAEFAVNGQRARSNNFQLDGQNNNDNSIGGPSIFFGNQDAISEVQVVTNYTAEYGRNMGAVVNYVTKSGTNAYHGTAYEFWTGNTFSSLENEEKSPVFGFCTPGQDPSTGCTKPEIPKLVDNRFGGTLGGPIIKDKLWFFGSGNFERQRFGGSPSSSAPSIVPTPNGVQQLSTAFPSSPVGQLLSTIGPTAVSVGNPSFTDIQDVLVTDQIDSSTGFAFPCTTQGVNGCTPIEFGAISRFVSQPFNDYEATGRVDIRLTQKANFFSRYIMQKQIFDGINFGLGTSVGDWQVIPSLSQQVGLDWARNFSNAFVNQVRFSYSRAYAFFNEGSYPSCNDKNALACPTEVDLIGDSPAAGNQDLISYGVAAGFPQGRIINVYQLQDNASILKGKHTLKFGAEVSQQRSPNVFLPFNNGDFLFATFNDLVANNPEATFFALGNPRLPFKETDLAFYFQNDWRIKDNLVLNLGLRWEWFQQAVNLLHDRSVAQQQGSSPQWDPSLSLSRTTVPRVDQDLNNFSPVVGFAWTPKSFLVIRGGFRMAYDPAFYNMFLNVATSAPATNFATLLGPVFGGGTVLPSSGFFGTDLAPFLSPQVPAGDPGFANELLVDRKFHNPYSEQWNFGIQRSINSRIVMELRYVGNHTVGNFQTLNGNPALQPLIDAGFQNVIPPGLTPCTDPTAPGSVLGYADCTRGNLIRYGNTAWSKYNGLQSELRIGGWHGLTATASYTWSKTIDNASEIFSTIGGGNTVSYAQNPFNTDRAERGPAGIDFPHVAGVTMIYELPFYRTQQGIVGRLLGGWQLNTTYRYSVGQPYTTIENHNSGSLCDPGQNFGRDPCRPILSSAGAPLDTVGACTDSTAADCGLVDFVSGAPTTFSAVHWIYNDPTAATFFGTPFAGARRNILRGQPISTANLSMYKDIKISEKFKLQLQAQAFNIMNVQFRGVPDPVLNHVVSGSFQNTEFNNNGGLAFAGNLTTDGIARRRLLFGLKLLF